MVLHDCGSNTILAETLKYHAESEILWALMGAYKFQMNRAEEEIYHERKKGNIQGWLGKNKMVLGQLVQDCVDNNIKDLIIWT